MVGWFKKWWRWVLGILGALFVVLTAGIIIHEKRKLGKVTDQLTVAIATRRIQELRAVRKEVDTLIGGKDEALGILDRKLKENMRQIVEAHEGGEDLSDEEMLAEFAALGL